MSTTITATSSEFYNPTYFNVLEQYKYDCIFLDFEYVAMEMYINDDVPVEEALGDVSHNARSRLQRIKDKYFKKGDDGKPLTKGQAFMEKMAKWFDYIKEKLRLIAQMFMDKVDELLKINDHFLKTCENAIKSIKDAYWNDVKIAIYQYDNQRIKNTIYAEFDIPKIDSRGDKLRKVLAYDTRDDMVKALFTKVTRLQDKEDSFTGALKTYYRNIRGSEKKVPTLEGDVAKKACLDAFVYCKNYKESIAKPIRDEISDLEGAMTRIKRDFETNKLEQYITSESYIPLFEQDTTAANPEPKLGTVGTVSGAKNGAEAVEPKDANHVGTKVFTRIKQYGDILMQILTAQMTIAEERYYTSMHVLKAVYSQARKQGNIDQDAVAAADAADANQRASVNDAQNLRQGKNIVRKTQELGPD